MDNNNGLPVFEVIEDNDHITILYSDNVIFEGQLKPGLSAEDKHSAIIEAQSEIIAQLINSAIHFGMALANGDNENE